MSFSLFLLAASEFLRVNTVWQALPLFGLSFVRKIKVKFHLLLRFRWIICFFPFPCLRGIFYVRKAFVLLKFQTVFRDEDEKRIVPTALEAFSPEYPKDRRQNTANLSENTNADSRQSTNQVSSIRRLQATPWGLHKHSHTLAHRPCLSPHSTDLPQNFSIIQLSACFFKEYFCTACIWISLKEVQFCEL